jgi:hypothetical protein
LGSAQDVPFLRFETLTFAPFDRRLIEPSLLGRTEIDWLDTYHAKVWEVVGPHMPPADRDWLHLEGRYNYEALDTGSAWVGYNFSGGDMLAWEITPMLGGVFGDTTGVAPGYKGSLGWWKLELYSEGEYVYDTGSDASYVTAGLGFVTPRVGLDAAARRQVSEGDELTIQLSLRLFLPN